MWTKYESKKEDFLNGKIITLIGSSSMDTDRSSSNFIEDIYYRTGMLFDNRALFGSYLTSQVEDYMTEANNQIKRLSDITIIPDAIICHLGLNDDTYKRPLGTWSSTSTTEFYGALHEFCKVIYNKFPETPKGIVTGQYFGTQDAKESEYQDALKEVAFYYGIPVLDLRAVGQTPYHIHSWRGEYGIDNLHLKTKGNKILAKPVEAFLRRLLGQ